MFWPDNKDEKRRVHIFLSIVLVLVLAGVLLIYSAVSNPVEIEIQPATQEVISPEMYREKVNGLILPQGDATLADSKAWVNDHLAQAVPYLLEAKKKTRLAASPYLLAAIFDAWRAGLLSPQQKQDFVTDAITVSWEAKPIYAPEGNRLVFLHIMGLMNYAPSPFMEAESKTMPWDFLKATYTAQVNGKHLRTGETRASDKQYIYLPANLEPGKHTLNALVEFSEKQGLWRHTLQASSEFRIASPGTQPAVTD